MAPHFALALDVAYAPEDSDAVMAAYERVRDAALRAQARMRLLPHAPDIPRELRGRRAFVVEGTYTGPLQDAYDAVRPIRTAARPLLDRTEPVEASGVPGTP